MLDGYFDVWNRWALRQVNALHAAGRMFQERDHVHTLLYNFEWEHRRDPDGVPVELALDHPYRGVVAVFVDRDASVSNEELWSWLRTEHLPRPAARDRRRPGGRVHADRARSRRAGRRAA